jgi:ABC-type multidrug transport system ATPase subunit
MIFVLIILSNICYDDLILYVEPTSGLDSSTSIVLLSALHRLSDLGVNIIATLHQPRQEIIDLLHTLILLGPGGRLVRSIYTIYISLSFLL